MSTDKTFELCEKKNMSTSQVKVKYSFSTTPHTIVSTHVRMMDISTESCLETYVYGQDTFLCILRQQNLTQHNNNNIHVNILNGVGS